MPKPAEAAVDAVVAAVSAEDGAAQRSARSTTASEPNTDKVGALPASFAPESAGAPPGARHVGGARPVNTSATLEAGHI